MFTQFWLFQESITRSVYLTHDYVLGLWVNRFAWINWIPWDSMYQCALQGKLPLFPYAGNWKSKNKYGGGRFIAEDIHFQFSQWLWLWYFTEETSENENENLYTEASSDNYHQTQKATQSLKSAGVRWWKSRSTGSSCHPVELIKLLKTTHKKWQPVCFREGEEAKSIEQELREELFQSPRIGIENYPSRKAFATHLSDGHSSTFSDLTNGSSRKYATLSLARFEEKGRDKRNKKAAFTITRMKFLLKFQTQKRTQERITVVSCLSSARLQGRQPSLLHDTVHAVICVIHEKVYDKVQREVSKKKLDSLTSVAAVHETRRRKRRGILCRFGGDALNRVIELQEQSLTMMTLVGWKKGRAKLSER